ncbi:unannotated protein [freshwater metagenome]|uniref:Unannotated protein n=1 Tax=freshwater metagenome TaxID=449393 RepID=A0A6J7SSU0_9ZZZZ|nr:hypothetical protein [Actinomycetota bacterium]MTB10616.1 hypothetical protein [Actinomycetota bacterium]
MLKRYPKFGSYACVALIGLFLAWYLFSLTKNQTFIHEEWTWLADRSHLSFHALLDDNFGHTSVVPVIFYLVIFHIFGLDSYEVFRLVLVFFHLAIIFFVFSFVRRRHGLIIGGSIATALALLGTGAQNFIWTFQIGFVGGFLFFLIALRCLQRANNSLGLLWPIFTCLSVGLSVASAGTGLGSLAVILILTLCGANRRRFWWVGIAPLALYVVWYSQYGGQDSPTSALSTIPGHVAHYGAAAMSGLFGVDQRWGWPMLGIVVILLLKSLRKQRFDLLPLSFLIFVLVFWLGTSYARGGSGGYGASRYVYVGAISLVLAISENVEPMLGKKPTRLRVTQSSVVIMAVLSIWGTHSELSNYQRFHSAVGLSSAGRLVVAESHRDDIDGEATLVSFLGIQAISASGYFQTIDYFKSSPVAQFRDLAQAPRAVRFGADTLLFEFGFAAIDGPLENNLVCVQLSLADEPLLVLPGSRMDIVVTRTTTISAARFSSLNSKFPLPMQQILRPGSYSIFLAADDLGGSLQTKFDDPTAVMTCD